MIGSAFWGLAAIIVTLAGLVSAPIMGGRYSVRGVALWRVICVGLSIGPLIMLAFYAARLPGYHGVCTGIFGDTEPCSFVEFADYEANKLIFIAPIGIAAFVFYWLAYLGCQISKRKRRGTGQSVSSAKSVER